MVRAPVVERPAAPGQWRADRVERAERADPAERADRAERAPADGAPADGAPAPRRSAAGLVPPGCERPLAPVGGATWVLEGWLQELLIERGDSTPADLTETLRRRHPLLDTASVATVVHRVLRRAAGLAALEPFLADDAVTEIMINGPGPVWVDRHGRLAPSAVVLDRHDIVLLIERILEPLGLRVDRSSPVVDARLPDGSRVNVVVPPLALDGPVITIRRFGPRPVALGRFGGAEVGALLADLVAQRATMLVVGSTGAGKTTLLNALGSQLDPTERVVTIEDTAELRLPGRHVVRLEARPANSEGVGAVDLRALVRNALRMRPDRLVIGEVRGPEALDLVLALNTGHRGSLATCHASGPAGALLRLEALALLGGVDLPAAVIRAQLASAFDVIVTVARQGAERRVVDVTAVDDQLTADGSIGRQQLWAP